MLVLVAFPTKSVSDDENCTITGSWQQDSCLAFVCCRTNLLDLYVQAIKCTCKYKHACPISLIEITTGGASDRDGRTSQRPNQPAWPASPASPARPTLITAYRGTVDQQHLVPARSSSSDAFFSFIPSQPVICATLLFSPSTSPPTSSNFASFF